MGRHSASKLLMGVLILLLHTSSTYQETSQTTGNSLAMDEGKYMDTVLINVTASGAENEKGNRSNEESFQSERAKKLQKLREQITFAKRTQQRIFVHDPDDIFFMLTAIILLCFHVFFLDMFIRLTRTRFPNNARYQYLTTVHLFLTFLVCAIYFLLILLHYRDSQYCG